MKRVLQAIWNFLTAVGEASYAAHLARNGQYTKATNLYK